MGSSVNPLCLVIMLFWLYMWVYIYIHRLYSQTFENSDCFMICSTRKYRLAFPPLFSCTQRGEEEELQDRGAAFISLRPISDLLFDIDSWLTKRRVTSLRSDPDMGSVGSLRLRDIDWEQESYPTYVDFAVLPLFALFFPSVRFFLDRCVFEVPRLLRLCPAW